MGKHLLPLACSTETPQRTVAIWLFLFHGTVNLIRVPEKFTEKISVEESKDVEEETSILDVE